MTRHDDKYEHVPPAAEDGAAPWCRGQVARPVLSSLRAVPTLSTVPDIKGRGAECVTKQIQRIEGAQCVTKQEHKQRRYAVVSRAGLRAAIVMIAGH